MVDLAKEAFNTQNFQLAAEIYERTIKENGPSLDLCMGLADSFACGGHFEKAFDAYASAFRLGNLTPSSLNRLVSALVNAVKQDNIATSANMSKSCMFTCTICRGLFNEPLTIPCGHTYCRKCFERDQSKTCRTCGTIHHFVRTSSFQSNVLLSRLIESWFPNESKATCLKAEGNKFFERRQFDKSIELYSLAIELSPRDHLLLSNRSHAYASLDRFSEAMEDAEKVVELRPDWPKGYFRKGCAQFGMNLFEDAVVSLLQCLALDSEVESAKDYLSKSLHKILSPFPNDDVKALALKNQFNPSLLTQLIRANFSSALLLPHITMDKLDQLKGIIDETLFSATNFVLGQTEKKPSFDKDGQSSSGQMPREKNGNAETTFSHKCASEPSSRRESPVSFLKGARSRSQSPYGRNSDGSRKRTREPSITQPPLSPQETPQKQQKSRDFVPMDVSKALVNVDDFECSLCYRLMHEPVTTPCGHSFCRQCLDRCLDHQSNCPLCKGSLVEYLAERRQTRDESLENILKTYFPEEHEARKKIHEDELVELAKMGEDEKHHIPIFVCTLAFPGVTCPLHIFEPRYRLMVRQCMEAGTRQFGMCISMGDDQDDFSEYGCMLEIRDVQFFPDGRSLVDCIGGRRFKVLSRGHRDGYNTANVEFLRDVAIPENDVQAVNKLQEKTYREVKSWFDNLPGMQRNQISRHFGGFPACDSDYQGNPNSTAWLWKVLPILPLDPRIQLTMLAMTSYKERLEGILRVLEYIKRRRSF
ncbi:LON peptidase N-terminal domain and RING finger protein 1-like [Saccostrea echinata]|uniref:LON peptidase N-terminal domain and RING finger protein 1-like n=1 Tax=Saccostrea echinata TaxID=191078 RepID=UPI002A806DC4|nr:LON peptidase N-terminal domain and RING finger protein 1-like [Saccostrea echinata]